MCNLFMTYVWRMQGVLWRTMCYIGVSFLRVTSYCVNAVFTLPILIICHASWFNSVPELIKHHGLHPQEIYEGVQLLVPVHYYIRRLYCEAVILCQLPAEALSVTVEVGVPFI